MKYLNNHLAEYMSRVQELKAANKRLEAENKKCLKRINEPKPDYYAMHWGELQVGSGGKYVGGSGPWPDSPMA